MQVSNASFLGTNQLVKQVNGTIVALTGYAGNTAFEAWHAHANPSISFLLSGTHTEALQGCTITRMPGDIKFIPAGVQHRCYNYAPGTRKINLDLDAGMLRKMEISEERLSQLLDRTEHAKFALLRLYRQLYDQSNHATLAAEEHLYELFYPGQPASLHGKQPPAWMRRLKSMLHDEWQQPFTLRQLSVRLAVHPVTISRYAPLYLGATLGNYMLQIKTDKAITLIKTTGASLTEIAYQCGFADQAHFTRTFKITTGFLPRDFRKL